jgi:TolB protein
MRNTLIAAAAVFLAACGHSPDAGQPAVDAALQNQPVAVPAEADEPRLANLTMLTNIGENAEAYFSADGRQLIFQASRPGIHACDQIFTMDVDGGNVRQVSTGRGATTCGYWFPSGRPRGVRLHPRPHGRVSGAAGHEPGVRVDAEPV